MAMMRFSSADDPALKALQEKTKKGPIRLKRLKLPTFNAKTRGGYAKGRMKAGELNETEKRYRDFLESERFHGRIQAWWFESIKLKIADHVWNFTRSKDLRSFLLMMPRLKPRHAQRTIRFECWWYTRRNQEDGSIRSSD